MLRILVINSHMLIQKSDKNFKRLFFLFFLGLGVRIEDDILITKGANTNQLSCEVLSKGCPKEVDEIEDLMLG